MRRCMAVVRMSDYAIQDTITGRFVIAAYRYTNTPTVFTQKDGALMWASADEAERAKREFGLDETYKVVQL